MCLVPCLGERNDADATNGPPLTAPDQKDERLRAALRNSHAERAFLVPNGELSLRRGFQCIDRCVCKRGLH